MSKVKGWTFMVCYGKSAGWGARRGPLAYGVMLGRVAVTLLKVDAEALIVESRRHMDVLVEERERAEVRVETLKKGWRL